MHWVSKRRRRALPFLKAGFFAMVVDKKLEIFVRNDPALIEFLFWVCFVVVCREWKKGGI